jgi:hypothetical protein
MHTINRLISDDKKSLVTTDAGELISYIKNGEELIHQKGDPGWRNSDTEMFPLIGPTEANDFRVDTDRGEAIQDQHGLLRELSYIVSNKTESSVEFVKSYLKHTKVENSKYPDKSNKEFVFWPYSFEFKKQYELSNDSLKIQFEISGEKGMPFMLGYHPAFKLSGNNNETFEANKQRISLQDILNVGSIAYPVLDADEIHLIKPDRYNVSIKTHGFDNFMLWTEVPNMVCVEPISAYPYTGKQKLEKDLFRVCNEKDHFEVCIEPFK